MTRCYEYYCMFEKERQQKCFHKCVLCDTSERYVTEFIDFLKQKGVKFDKTPADKMRFKAAIKKYGTERPWNRARQSAERQKALEARLRGADPPRTKTILGDFREVETQIPPASVDLLFTDPPYAKEYLDLWKDLAKVAARVLKPGGYLVSYAPQAFLPEILTALLNHLNYYWTAGVHHNGGEARIFGKQLWVRWKPLIIFCQGKGADHEWIQDLIEGQEGNKDDHEWAQGESEAAYFIEKLTPIGGTVLDPMMGSGTTLRAALKLGRAAIGIEKDPETYAGVRLDG